VYFDPEVRSEAKAVVDQYNLALQEILTIRVGSARTRRNVLFVRAIYGVKESVSEVHGFLSDGRRGARDHGRGRGRRVNGGRKG